MFRRLFLSSQIQNAFVLSKIDNTHELMSTLRVLDLAVRYFIPRPKSQSSNFNININISNNCSNQINIQINQPKKEVSYHDKLRQKRNELTELILKKIRSNKPTLQIKCLILAHSIIKKTRDQQFMEIIANQINKYIQQDIKYNIEPTMHLRQEEKETAKGKLQNEHSNFVQTNIISFYCKYLKKFILSFQIYEFASDFIFLSQVTADADLIQIINKGFIILNLVNMILQSQSTFNKMGRYFKEQEEMINLLIMFLLDLTSYNTFIKKIASISFRNIQRFSPQAIKHYYLFVTEAQKASDRFYQFFYNRYYYKRVKEIVLIPKFLAIGHSEFNQFQQILKKIDKELVILINQSKYTEQVKSRFKSKTTLSFKTEQQDFNHKTQIFENTKNSFQQFKSYIKDDQLQKSLEDFELTYKIKTMKIKKQSQN